MPLHNQDQPDMQRAQLGHIPNLETVAPEERGNSGGMVTEKWNTTLPRGSLRKRQTQGLTNVIQVQCIRRAEIPDEMLAHGAMHGSGAVSPCASGIAKTPREFQKAPLDSCALCGFYCSKNWRKYKRLNGDTKKELHDSWQYLPYERAWSEPVLKHNALLHGKRMFAGEDICIRCIDENNFAKPGTSCSDVAVSDTLADLLARERTTVMHECAAEMERLRAENNHLRLQLQHQSRHDLSQRDMEIAEALAAVACRTPCPGVLAGSAVCSESSIGAYTILATIFDIEYPSQYHNFN